VRLKRRGRRHISTAWRRFGSKRLQTDRYASDFKKLADEILGPLGSTPGVTLNVTIEIEATTLDGFDDAKAPNGLRERGNTELRAERVRGQLTSLRHLGGADRSLYGTRRSSARVMEGLSSRTRWRELEPLFVGGDGDVELVEESGEPEEPECRGPGFAEPHWCAPLVRVRTAGDLEARYRHTSGDQ
jgi:hypothetical protein